MDTLSRDPQHRPDLGCLGQILPRALRFWVGGAGCHLIGPLVAVSGGVGNPVVHGKHPFFPADHPLRWTFWSWHAYFKGKGCGIARPDVFLLRGQYISEEKVLDGTGGQ